MRRVLFACLGVVACLPVVGLAGPGTVSGDIAYSEPAGFDYSGDGEIAPVQLWVKFEAREAVGVPGQPGFEPEQGHVSRRLVDARTMKTIPDFPTFTMLAAFNDFDTAVPISDIRVKDNTAKFTVRIFRYTATDGGEGYQNDRLFVTDGTHEYELKLYGGDIKVTPASDK